jgi:hypothetical protein
MKPDRKTETTNNVNVKAAEHGCFLIVALSLVGLFVAQLFRSVNIDQPHNTNAFYYLYCHNEPAMLVLFLMLSAILLVAFRFHWLDSIRFPDFLFSLKGGIRGVLLVSLVVFSACLIGTFVVFHNFPLSMDEYMADFQARIFAAGKIKAAIPLEWQKYGLGLAPIYSIYNPHDHTWMSSYLPVYALLRTPFQISGVACILNPLLAASSIVVLAGVCRNLWPGNLTRMWIAVIILATSSQFLITSMTAYSMPAHLFFNLLWLYFYTAETRTATLLVPWVGFFAMGLHQPHVHLLFVAPFFIRLIMEKNLRKVSYWGIVYGAGILLWTWWMTMYRTGIQAPGVPSVVTYFGIPRLIHVIIQLAHLNLFLSWQSFILLLLIYLFFSDWRKASPLSRDLAWGFLLTILFHFFLLADQGHGWGYRYCHSVLGNFALISVAGFYRMIDLLGTRTSNALMSLSILLALFVQLPVRSWQARSFISPFYQSATLLTSRPEEIVILEPNLFWYYWDLVRNDPLFRIKPIIVDANRLTTSDVSLLKAKYTYWQPSISDFADFKVLPNRNKK